MKRMRKDARAIISSVLSRIKECHCFVLCRPYSTTPSQRSIRQSTQPFSTSHITRWQNLTRVLPKSFPIGVETGSVVEYTRTVHGYNAKCTCENTRNHGYPWYTQVALGSASVNDENTDCARVNASSSDGITNPPRQLPRLVASSLAGDVVCGCISANEPNHGPVSRLNQPSASRYSDGPKSVLIPGDNGWCRCVSKSRITFSWTQKLHLTPANTPTAQRNLTKTYTHDPMKCVCYILWCDSCCFRSPGSKVSKCVLAP